MTYAVIVRQSSLRTQWWLLQYQCIRHLSVHSDDLFRNTALVITLLTETPYAVIVRPSSLRTLNIHLWCKL